MRRPSLLPSLFPSLLLLLSTTSAQRIVDELSFGHKGRLSPLDGQSIPGWHGSSVNHNIQILSDRAILTPPVPGNARGALWTDKPIDSETWIADIEFRASGQDRGSGNLNVWFAKDKTSISIDNLYTVANFDGLVVTIDQYGGTGGKIRGFLNDGSQNFRQQNSLESLAFGHCDYSYRNLGRPSKLKVTSQDGLTVSIDDKECFRSSKITLPSSYYFGLTAATGENPDSFEVNKFVVTSSIPHTHQNVVKGGPPPIPDPNSNSNQNPASPNNPKFDTFPGAPEAVPDRAASEIKTQDEQFADLHNRLQALSHRLTMVFAEIAELGKRLPAQSSSGSGGSGSGSGGASLTDVSSKLEALTSRLGNIENTLQQQQSSSSRQTNNNQNLDQITDLTRKGFENIDSILKEIRGRVNYNEHFHHLNQAVLGISASTPRMGMFVFIVVVVQVGLAGSYVVYKRRRNGMPKKYL